MRMRLITAIFISLLSACQSAIVKENDPPVFDESQCQDRRLEAGQCKGEY